MLCPKCGKELIQNKKALSCSGWRDGCDFTIWDVIAGHALTADEKQQLVETGVTSEVIQDFNSKKGSQFAARLKLDDEKRVVFDFPKKESKTVLDENLRCPTCGSPIRKGPNAWGCSNRACNVVVFSTLAKHVFSDDEKVQLLKGATIGPIGDFVSKRGSLFEARVKLGIDGRPGFIFDDDEPSEPKVKAPDSSVAPTPGEDEELPF